MTISCVDNKSDGILAQLPLHHASCTTASVKPVGDVLKYADPR